MCTYTRNSSVETAGKFVITKICEDTALGSETCPGRPDYNVDMQQVSCHLIYLLVLNQALQ